MSWLRILKSISIMLIIALAINLKPSMANFKAYDVPFKENKTFYMYSGAKGTIRFTDIPGDVDLVQIQNVENPKAPIAYIIGKRNKTIERSTSGNIVEFNIELVEPEAGNYPRAAVELRVKGFRKNGEAYDVTHNFSIYIRIRDCVPKGDPVCAMAKVRCRPELSPTCIDGQEEKLLTFASECDMEKHSAEFFAFGPCTSSQ